MNLEDQKYQHILLTEAPENILKEYAFDTLTNEINCVPFLTLRALRDIADLLSTRIP